LRNLGRGTLSGYKEPVLARLAERFPQRFVLVGDSGERDPEISVSFARAHPGRVLAAYARRAGEVRAVAARTALIASSCPEGRMRDDEVSNSALMLAYFRGYHSANDDPKIFDDFLATRLFTEKEHTLLAKRFAPNLLLVALYDPAFALTWPDKAAIRKQVMQAVSPLSLGVSRARYTEDGLDQALRAGVRQYVILGAGFDTFAFRRPELKGQLEVFEVDHPATQASKRQRISQAGWREPDHLHFIPLDFRREGLAAALRRSPFDGQAQSFFSWLGCTYYLAREDVFATFRAMAEVAPAGSTVVFDYLSSEAFPLERSTKRLRFAARYNRKRGEPMILGLDPSTLEADLDQAGLRLQESLSPATIESRYFEGRFDNYHAYDHMHFAAAVVK
jgi:methyltransferase (TIGR00027 family)